MPHVNANISRAWRQAGEQGRIHYVIQRVGPGITGTRRLYVDEGHPLYDVLDEYLLAQGYTAPASEGSTTLDVPTRA